MRKREWTGKSEKVTKKNSEKEDKGKQRWERRYEIIQSKKKRIEKDDTEMIIVNYNTNFLFALHILHENDKKK